MLTRAKVNAFALLFVVVLMAVGQGGFGVYPPSSAGAGSGTVTNIATDCMLSGGPITTTGTLKVSQAVNAQTGTSYTILAGDCGKLVTFTNGSAIAVTLPQAGGTFPAGWLMDVQNRGAGTVTITPTTSTVDGAASLALTQNQGVRIVSDGTNYFTMRGIGGSSTTLDGLSDVSITSPLQFQVLAYDGAGNWVNANPNATETDGGDSVAFSATPTFTCSSTVNGFRMTLTANVTSITMASCANRTFVLTFTQDGTGGRTVTWPAGFINEPSVNTAANATTSMVFRADNAGTTFYAMHQGLVAGPSNTLQFNYGVYPPELDPVSGGLVDRRVAASYTAGAKQTTAASATTAGSNIACSALPSSPATGDVACDSGDGNKLKQYNGSSWVDLTATGGGGNFTGAGAPVLEFMPFAGNSGATAPTANLVYCWAWAAPYSITITEMAVYTTTGLGADESVRMGVYSDAGSLLDSGIVTGASGANILTVTFSEALTAGTRYSFCLATEDTGLTFRNMFFAGSDGAMYNQSGTVVYTCQNGGSGTGGSYVLPATCGTKTALNTGNMAYFNAAP